MNTASVYHDRIIFFTDLSDFEIQKFRSFSLGLCFDLTIAYNLKMPRIFFCVEEMVWKICCILLTCRRNEKDVRVR